MLGELRFNFLENCCVHIKMPYPFEHQKITQLNCRMTLVETFPNLKIPKSVMTAKATKEKLADVFDDINTYLELKEAEC